MKKILIIALLIIANYAYVYAQATIPQPVPLNESNRIQQVIYNTTQGKNPLPFEKIRNLKDYAKENPEFNFSPKAISTLIKKEYPDKKGFVIVLKTEHCCTESRACAITTGCFEEFLNDPGFKDYAIVGMRVAPDKQNKREPGTLDTYIKDMYKFKQGPGAAVLVYDTTKAGPPTLTFKTTAEDLGFYTNKTADSVSPSRVRSLIAIFKIADYEKKYPTMKGRHVLCVPYIKQNKPQTQWNIKCKNSQGESLSPTLKPEDRERIIRQKTSVVLFIHQNGSYTIQETFPNN